jgi:phage terminase large subunit-like protein
LQPQERITEFLDGLSAEAVAALPYVFEFWALPHQRRPEGDWKTWVIMGGRGAGKTRAGSEWVRAQVEGARPRDAGRARRVALVGETYDQAIAVMIKGESGILACSPPDRRPKFVAGERKLIWPNGAEAQVYSAHDPEALRGPQFDAAWVDELAKWRNAQATWDMLQFSLRLGQHPQQVVTTTPRNIALLRDLLARKTTVVTRAATEANRAYLAPSFLDEVRARYGKSRLGRQELDGELLEDHAGTLWQAAAIEAARVFDRDPQADVIVAVDPPVTGHDGSDLCGIVAVALYRTGRPQDWRAVVLEDASVSAASPQVWAEAAAKCYHRHGANRLVAEVNQGGDLVEAMMRQVDPLIAYRAVRATKGKVARAEPVAALYEQGRVSHLGYLPQLEDQMCQMAQAGFEGQGSPDRVDALVWALSEGLLEPARHYSEPRLRVL